MTGCIEINTIEELRKPPQRTRRSRVVLNPPLPLNCYTSLLTLGGTPVAIQITPPEAQSTPSFGTERLIIFTNHPIHFSGLCGLHTPGDLQNSSSGRGHVGVLCGYFLLLNPGIPQNRITAQARSEKVDLQLGGAARAKILMVLADIRSPVGSGGMISLDASSDARRTACNFLGVAEQMAAGRSGNILLAVVYTSRVAWNRNVCRQPLLPGAERPLVFPETGAVLACEIHGSLDDALSSRAMIALPSPVNITP